MSINVPRLLEGCDDKLKEGRCARLTYWTLLGLNFGSPLVYAVYGALLRDQVLVR